MKMKKLPLALAIGAALLAGNAAAVEVGGQTVKGTLELEFRSNDNISVAPASTDSFDFADFGDFAEAEAKLREGDDEDEEGGGEDGEDDESDDGEDFGDDDFDDIGLDDTDLSEDEFDLATDDDDGDGDEDDEDDDGMDDDDEDDGDDGDGDGKRAVGNDESLDDLISAAVSDKATQRRQSQNRLSSKIGLSHKFAFDGGVVTWGSTLRGVGDFHNGKDSLDKQNFAVSTGPEFNLKDIGLKIKPAMSYVFIRQNGNKIVGTLVGTLAASYDFNKRFTMDAVYNYQDQDISDPDSPDAIINTFTLGAQLTATKTDIFKIRYSPRVEDSSLTTKNKDTSGWQLTYSRKLPWDMILGLGVKDDFVDFVNLPVRREDDVRAYSIDLAKQFSKTFEMGLAYENRRLDSNVNSKDAENRSMLISGTWKF
jgi:hypothetical protein